MDVTLDDGFHVQRRPNGCSAPLVRSCALLFCLGLFFPHTKRCPGHRLYFLAHSLGLSCHLPYGYILHQYRHHHPLMFLRQRGYLSSHPLPCMFPPVLLRGVILVPVVYWDLVVLSTTSSSEDRHRPVRLVFELSSLVGCSAARRPS